MVIRTLPPDSKVYVGQLEKINGVTMEVKSIETLDSGSLKVVYVRSKEKLEPSGSNGIVVRW